MKRIAVFIAFTAFISPGTVFADRSCTVEAVHFLPPAYFIGDTVTLRITLGNAGDCDLTVPETLPQNRWVRINAVDLDRSGDAQVITVRFITFYPGERQLPPIEFGDFVLRNITLSPDSVVEETGREFAPLRSEMLLPGTRLFLFVLFSGTAVVVLFLTLALPRIRSRMDRLRQQRSIRRMKRRLLSELERLEKAGAGIDTPEFYRCLSHGVKEYLGEKKKVDCFPLTSGEMRKVVDAAPELSEGLPDQIYTLLKRSELVRFGGMPVSGDLRKADLQTVSVLVEAMDRSSGERPSGGRLSGAEEAS